MIRPEHGLDEEYIVTKQQLQAIRATLLEQRELLLSNARKAVAEEIGLDINELPDDMDFATSQSNQGITLSLRSREHVLLKKIDKAITRMDQGEFGDCEMCGEAIGLKRLTVRPVTTLCIRCKQEQEDKERLLD